MVLTLESGCLLNRIIIHHRKNTCRYGRLRRLREYPGNAANQYYPKATQYYTRYPYGKFVNTENLHAKSHLPEKQRLFMQPHMVTTPGTVIIWENWIYAQHRHCRHCHNVLSHQCMEALVPIVQVWIKGSDKNSNA